MWSLKLLAQVVMSGPGANQKMAMHRTSPQVDGKEGRCTKKRSQTVNDRSDTDGESGNEETIKRLRCDRLRRDTGQATSDINLKSEVQQARYSELWSIYVIVRQSSSMGYEHCKWLSSAH